MTEKESLIKEYVQLALEDALDDVNVSRDIALSRHTLSPAASPNPVRQQRFLELNGLLSGQDLEEVNRQFKAELAKKTHYASGAPIEYPTRLVIHVGPGLDSYLRESPRSVTHDLSCVALNTTANVTKGGHTRIGSELLIAPENYRSVRTAAFEVLRKFRVVRASDEGVLTVVTFSEGVLSAVINALIELEFDKDLLVVLHQADGAYSTHRLDYEGFLQDWPYGVLYPSLGKEDLEELGFECIRCENSSGTECCRQK